VSETEIPDRVFRFLSERIDTVPQLEALRLLAHDPQRAWSVEDLASRIYVRPEAAAEVLRALERRQLARPSAAPPLAYRYDGAWDPSGERMAEIDDAYRHHLIRLATFIHRSGSSSVREFARAFDLKKDR
jgi:hypothetical protein